VNALKLKIHQRQKDPTESVWDVRFSLVLLKSVTLWDSACGIRFLQWRGLCFYVDAEGPSLFLQFLQDNAE
jgi:hypothetical protein